MQISAKELRHLASDVDEMHYEAMLTFQEETTELHRGETPEMWFPTEAFEAASVGHGTDPLMGFDPAVFA